jgi:hypothetical protein
MYEMLETTTFMYAVVSSNAIIINIATVFRLLIRDYEEKYLTAF